MLFIKTSKSSFTNSDFMQGGERTHDEMCLSFLIYYPRIQMGECGSIPQVPAAYTPFTEQHLS